MVNKFLRFLSPIKYRVMEEHDSILNKNYFYAQVSCFYALPYTWMPINTLVVRYCSLENAKNELRNYINGVNRKYHKV